MTEMTRPWTEEETRWAKEHADQMRPAKPMRRSDLAAHLVDAPVATRTRVWTALETIECFVCEQHIEEGALFTMALASGAGRKHVPHCRGCRRFSVEFDDSGHAKVWGER